MYAVPMYMYATPHYVYVYPQRIAYIPYAPLYYPSNAEIIDERVNFETAKTAYSVAMFVLAEEEQDLCSPPQAANNNYPEQVDTSYPNIPEEQQPLQIRQEALLEHAKEAVRKLFAQIQPTDVHSNNSAMSGRLLTYFNVHVGLKVCFNGETETIAKVVDNGYSKNIQINSNGNPRSFSLFRNPRGRVIQAWIL